MAPSQPWVKLPSSLLICMPLSGGKVRNLPTSWGHAPDNRAGGLFSQQGKLKPARARLEEQPQEQGQGSSPEHGPSR